MADIGLDVSGVYAICHLPTGRVYVGGSIHIGNRWRRHIQMLHAGTHPTAALQNAWLEDGPTAFEFKILEQAPRESVFKREQEWLRRSANVLNTSRRTPSPSLDPDVRERIAAGVRRAFADPVRREKVSQAVAAANRRRVHTEEANARRRAFMLGQKRGPLSAEHKETLRLANIGRHPNLEARAKMSTAQRRRAPVSGSPEAMAWMQMVRAGWTPDRGSKIGARLQGHVVSEITRSKISAANKGPNLKLRGRAPSVETRRKISEAKKGRLLSPEHRAKISASLRAK